MLYIIVALKSEAQAFVDKYKLKKLKIKNYTLFSNASLKLIVSGIGVSNATKATQTLIDYFDINERDIYLNIGICGADNSYKIGELIQIGSISYENSIYTFSDDKHIVCLDEPSSSAQHCIVDMESFGFYNAIIHSPAIRRFYVFKVVSDNFEPHKVTKEATKKLIFNQIHAINKLLNC